MYNTGNTTKNASILLGRNIIVNEPCSDVDFRYGPYRSTSEALEWIDKHLRNLGLTVGIIEDGKIVEYWFKSDINTLVKKVDDSQELYSPSDSIPNDAFSETILASKSSLEGLTVSQILDKILFKDQPAFINANAGNCNVSAITGLLEVGSDHTIDQYRTQGGTASFGYPPDTRDWLVFSKSVDNQKIILGANNTCTCVFTLTGIPEVLKSSYGVVPAKLPTYSTRTSKTATITGYYNCGFSYGYPNPSWTTFKVTDTGKIILLTTQRPSLYIYVLLPSNLRIGNTIEIHHPLKDSYLVLENVSPVKVNDRSVTESTISVNYLFNIWKLPKAVPNADGDPTPNPLTMRITISKNN